MPGIGQLRRGYKVIELIVLIVVGNQTVQEKEREIEILIKYQASVEATHASAALDTLIVRRSSFCLRNVIMRVSCSTGFLATEAPDEPVPWLEPPRRYAFLISISVVFTQPGMGRCTSQKARSCESSTLRSSLSRFLATLLCDSACKR